MADTLSVFKYYLYYRYKKQSSDRNALERWQVQKIRKHLEYVEGHFRLYKGTKKLFSYPVIDKKFMTKHFDELSTAGIGRGETLEFTTLVERQRNSSPKLKEVTVGLSSSISGKQGTFLISDDEKNCWVGYIPVRLLPGSLFETYSIAFFMRADSNLYQAMKSKNIQFHFFDIYRDTEEYRKRLEEIRPRILAEQPSLLFMTAEDVREGKADTYPRIIISIAEALEQADEQRMREAFGLSVIHQVYQCTEECLTAICSMGALYLNEDIAYTEREYLDDRRLVSVVTDLKRKAQPIIRYRLNDILVERKEPCGHGSPLLALEKIEGREGDVLSLKGKDGRNTPVSLDSIGRRILSGDKGSGENQVGFPGDYRIVQETDGRLTMYTDMTGPDRQRTLKEFELLPKDCDFLLPDISSQPHSCEERGKMKCVERRGAEPVKRGYI